MDVNEDKFENCITWPDFQLVAINFGGMIVITTSELRRESKRRSEENSNERIVMENSIELEACDSK